MCLIAVEVISWCFYLSLLSIRFDLRKVGENGFSFQAVDCIEVGRKVKGGGVPLAQSSRCGGREQAEEGRRAGAIVKQ